MERRAECHLAKIGSVYLQNTNQLRFPLGFKTVTSLPAVEATSIKIDLGYVESSRKPTYDLALGITRCIVISRKEHYEIN
jgi:hypothetical protein